MDGLYVRLHFNTRLDNDLFPPFNFISIFTFQKYVVNKSLYVALQKLSFSFYGNFLNRLWSPLSSKIQFFFNSVKTLLKFGM